MRRLCFATKKTKELASGLTVSHLVNSTMMTGKWYLLTYEKGFGDSFIADSVVYYDDLEETEAEIKAEIENY